MKLTVKQLIMGSDALKRLGEKGVKTLTYKTFYAVGKNIGHIDHELARYNRDYQRIIAEYSSVQPDGVYGVAAKDIVVLNQIIEEAQSVEVDIPIMVISMIEETMDKADIHAADWSVLDWMIILEEPK
jgi:hypothetical protein